MGRYAGGRGLTFLWTGAYCSEMVTFYTYAREAYRYRDVAGGPLREGHVTTGRALVPLGSFM